MARKARKPVDLRDLLRDPSQLLKVLPDPPRLSPILNRVIDEVMHPLAEERRELYLLDSALHMAVELGDALMQSVAKVVRYNVPKLLEKKER